MGNTDIDPAKINRNILSDKPRVTRFNIAWDGDQDNKIKQVAVAVADEETKENDVHYQEEEEEDVDEEEEDEEEEDLEDEDDEDLAEENLADTELKDMLKKNKQQQQQQNNDDEEDIGMMET